MYFEGALDPGPERELLDVVVRSLLTAPGAACWMNNSINVFCCHGQKAPRRRRAKTHRRKLAGKYSNGDGQFLCCTSSLVLAILVHKATIKKKGHVGERSVPLHCYIRESGERQLVVTTFPVCTHHKQHGVR